MVLFRQSSYRKVIKYLQKCGFAIKQGSNHAKATREQVTIIIPRHNKITSGVIKEITKTLVEQCGHDEDDIRKALK